MISRIISIKNPKVSPNEGTTPDNYLHSKFIIRRKYVENVLLPELKTLIPNTELFNAVIPPDYKQEYWKIYWKEQIIPIAPKYTDLPTACFLSHFSLWRYSVDNNCSIFILEDDAKIPENKEYFIKAIKEYETGDFDNDILYLQAAVPSSPTGLHTFPDNNPISPYLTRITSTGDLSGSAAYIIKPKAAKALIDRVYRIGAISPDSLLHRALNEKIIGVLVLTNYKLGFMLNDHFSEWNHKHSVGS